MLPDVIASYRYPPLFPKCIIGGMGALATVVIFIALSDPRSQSLAAIPIFVWLFLFLIFGCILYGVHIGTLEIIVEPAGLRVRSMYIHRYVAFHDVGSVRELNNGTWQTLDVQTRSGMRVLHTSNTAFPDFKSMVDAIKDGVAQADNYLTCTSAVL